MDWARYWNLRFLSEFLEELRFGAESEARKDGLDARTLGVPAPARWMLWFLRRFRFLRPIYSFFLTIPSSFVGCYLLLIRSGGVFFLTQENDSPEDWFRMGMALQSIWLEAHAQGLQFQPQGIPMMIYRAQLETEGRTSALFSPRERRHLESVQKDALSALRIDMRRPCLAFRAGVGRNASEYSFRKPVEISG